MKYRIFDNAGFLGNKLSISFLTEKLLYSKICGTKVGPSYNNGVKNKPSVAP